MDIFTLIYPFFPLSPSLWETARYRLKYCLKGPLNPKSTNQPNPSLWETARYKLKYCLKRPLSPKHPNPRWIVRSDVFVKNKETKNQFYPPTTNTLSPHPPPPPPPHPHNTLNKEQRVKQNRCFCRVFINLYRFQYENNPETL